MNSLKIEEMPTRDLFVDRYPRLQVHAIKLKYERQS